MNVEFVSFQTRIWFLSHAGQHDETLRQELGQIDGLALSQVTHGIKQRHQNGEKAKGENHAPQDPPRRRAVRAADRHRDPPHAERRLRAAAAGNKT